MKRKTISQEVAEIVSGHPVLGSATADAIAVASGEVKGKGHGKGGKLLQKKGRKAVVSDVKMVAVGIALAKRIEDVVAHKRDWVMALAKHSSAQLRDIGKGVADYYTNTIKSVKQEQSIEGNVSVGGGKSAASLAVRRTEITRVIEALRRAKTLQEDGDKDGHNLIMQAMITTKGWNDLYALSVQIRQEALEKPLTAAGVKEAVNKVFAERQAKPFSEAESDKWLDNVRRFKAASPAQLFRLLQSIVSIGVMTPGLAKHVDVRKLTESVRLTKLLTKHAAVERSNVESLADARRKMKAADRAVAEMQSHATDYQAVKGRVVGSRKAA